MEGNSGKREEPGVWIFLWCGAGGLIWLGGWLIVRAIW